MDWRDAKEPPDDMRPVLAFIPGSRLGSTQEEPDEWHVVYYKRGAYYSQANGYDILQPSHWTELEKP